MSKPLKSTQQFYLMVGETYYHPCEACGEEITKHTLYYFLYFKDNSKGIVACYNCAWKMYPALALQAKYEGETGRLQPGDRGYPRSEV